MAMFHTKVKLYLEANSKTWEDEFKKGDTYHIIFNDDETGFTKWDVDGLAQPTADQIASYETAGNAAEKLPVVLSARQLGYSKIADQLDKLWHDIDDGKLDKNGSWYKAIKAVKDDNPKG